MELLHQITEKLLKILHAYEGDEMGKLGAYLRSELGISPMAAILSVMIGCVCVYIMLVKPPWRSKEKRMLLSSKSLAALYGGDLAWQRLKDYKAPLAISDTLDRADLLLKDLLDVEDEQQLDLNKIQRVVEKVEKAGRDEGLRILKSAHGQHLDKSFFLHEIELALVEMLIYQGNPEEALECECLDYQRRIQFDARPPFFKAVIHGMRGEWEEAKKDWDEFVEMREGLISIVGDGVLPAGTLQTTSDFNYFKKIVQNLLNQVTNTKHKHH